MSVPAAGGDAVLQERHWRAAAEGTSTRAPPPASAPAPAPAPPTTTTTTTPTTTHLMHVRVLEDVVVVGPAGRAAQPSWHGTDVCPYARHCVRRLQGLHAGSHPPTHQHSITASRQRQTEPQHSSTPTRWAGGCRFWTPSSSAPGTQQTACGAVGGGEAGREKLWRAWPACVPARCRLPRRPTRSGSRCHAPHPTLRRMYPAASPHLQLPVPLRDCSMATCLPLMTSACSPYASRTLSSQNWRCPPMGRYSCKRTDRYIVMLLMCCCADGGGGGGSAAAARRQQQRRRQRRHQRRHQRQLQQQQQQRRQQRRQRTMKWLPDTRRSASRTLGSTHGCPESSRYAPTPAIDGDIHVGGSASQREATNLPSSPPVCLRHRQPVTPPAHVQHPRAAPTKVNLHWVRVRQIFLQQAAYRRDGDGRMTATHTDATVASWSPTSDAATNARRGAAAAPTTPRQVLPPARTSVTPRMGSRGASVTWPNQPAGHGREAGAAVAAGRRRLLAAAGAGGGAGMFARCIAVCTPSELPRDARNKAS